MDRNIIEKDGFYFIHNFDSGNLGHVERVPTELIASTLNPKTNSTETPDYEFNLWTRPDCAGTEFENGNRTWFYFGVQATHPAITVRLNLINLNKQGKMYNQGMAPVTRTLPGKPQWERIKDRPVHSLDDNTFSLSFKYKTSENLKATTFFAFTYPFSFAELQIALYSIDLKMLPMPPPLTPDDIYYYRENVIYSLEGRRVDLLTISSYHGITDEREDRLKNLFPDNQDRPYKFKNKKIIFMSARVHPGETPSSFVFNGFLTLLLSRNDPIAIQLRKLYVFKLIPFLNPDGVARGHYRTDTRGVNLNRVYLNPSLLLHPTVYASRALIRYYHFGVEKEDIIEEENICISSSSQVLTESDTTIKPRKVESVKSKIKTTISPPKQLTVEKKSEKTKPVPEINNKETVVAVAHPTPEPPTDQDLILNANTLRSCLGVNLQLTSSSELSQLGLQGSNPMKPLRETLKNSICLLMESNGSNADMALLKSRYPDIKMGTCKTCRKQKGDYSGTGFSFNDEIPRPSRFISDIEEYRERQKQQIDMEERKSQQTEAYPPEDCFFCTNCFKRFITSNGSEEIKVPSDNSLPSMAEADEGTEKEIANFDMTKMDLAKNRSPSPLAQSTSPTRNRQAAPSSAKTPPAPTKAQPIPAANKKPTPNTSAKAKSTVKETSGLYLYIDLHGHASKKGIFMYGNHFTEAESSVECMLLPRIMSLNNTHFHFSSCNFTERNMYLKDRRDGMSREGSGRVAVLKATGLVRSYTLECNYNTGRLVNVLPPSIKDGPTAPSLTTNTPLPPKYTPHIYEEIRQNPFRFRDKNLEFFEEMNALQVGYSLGASILDLTGHHPNSRIPCSEHRTLGSLRDWLRTHQKTLRPQIPYSLTTATRLRPKTSSPIRVPLFNKAKGTDERKENAFTTTKTETEKVKRPIPVFRQDLCNIKIAKKPEPVKSTSKTRISETETKSSLNSKRRNILAIRKPNTSKTQISAIIKAKVITRRSAEDNARNAVTSKLSKRSFNRSLRGSRADNIRRSLATSSSNDMINGNWDTKPTSHTESITSGKRRPFPTTSSTGLKKFRLKSVM